MLVLSGGPGDEERKLGTLIHHQAKEIESQLRIYRELTCAARLEALAAVQRLRARVERLHVEPEAVRAAGRETPSA